MKRGKVRLLPKKRTTGRISPIGGKEKSISKLINEADRLFSLKVRQSAWPEDNEVKFCYTCNHPAHWKKMHCGHYLSRYYKAARWHEDNARIQCMMCNLWKRGDPITFRQNLVSEIGEARVLAVEALRDAPIKLTREYLTSLIEQLKSGGFSTGE